MASGKDNKVNLIKYENNGIRLDARIENGQAWLTYEQAAAPDAAPGLTESLTKLTESFRQLSDTVKEQHQRLGRVEKQFGLPNSAAPAERVSKAADVDVGWPLDLNKPKDRENVDKAVSFHDL